MRRVYPFLLIVGACSEYTLGGDKDPATDPDDTDVGYGLCGFNNGPRTTETLDACETNALPLGFQPWVEWTGGRADQNCSATPVVADLDGDGMPEIIVNLHYNIFAALSKGEKGELWVYRGDGSSVYWKDVNAKLGQGSPLAVADLDGDGSPEILGIRAKGTAQPTNTKASYAVGVWSHDGTFLWETEYNSGLLDYDYSTAPIVSDMDADGKPEIIAGRIIYNHDGTVRGKGTHGHGSYGTITLGQLVITEATIPAVADLDLDGKQEVIVGNAMYNIDGSDKWFDKNRPDALISVANLDDDPEGEFIATSHGAIRAHDTDGTKLWGPFSFLCKVPACEDEDDDPGSAAAGKIGANILANAAIGDIDDDGYPEIITAGGSQLYALNHDGTVLWEKEVQDVSGATGASIFDFEGDGIEEVVYIDEMAVYAFDGPTGKEKFRSTKHASRTLMDYPVIADVDNDGSAEIVVGHMEYGKAFSVYGQGDGRWAPARKIWNQHAYSIANVNNDLSVPAGGLQGFQLQNTWHAATDPNLGLGDTRFDLQAEIVDVCDLQCGAGSFYVAVQAINRTANLDAPAGVPVTLYARDGAKWYTVATLETPSATKSGSSGDQLVFEVPAALARRADLLRVVVDDDGKGGSVLPECLENDNSFDIQGPFCP